MIQRGRRSAAAGAVVVSGGFGTRPEPPADLTKRQAEIWREVVASEPVEFFVTAVQRGLLSAYCRHREQGETLSCVINAEPELLKTDQRAYHRLLTMRTMETNAAILCARSLRLTTLSRYRGENANTAAKRVAKGQKPWDLAV